MKKTLNSNLSAICFSKRKVRNVLVLSICSSVCLSAHAALPSDAVLAFDPGVTGGYYSFVVSGSYFAMDTNGNGAFSSSERAPIEQNEGVRLGGIQPALGSHSGPPDGSELPSVDLPWSFFANTGMHQTTSPVVIINGDDGSGDGTASVDFSGWGVTWNGTSNIPLGGDSGNSPSDTGIAVINCSAECDIGDSYTIDYFAHVPVGDPSGFGGVHYMVHLEGAVITASELPPTKGVSIRLSSGNSLECSSPDGGVIQASADIATTDINDVASISWILDGAEVGIGESISVIGSLGDHTLEVSVDTLASGLFQGSVDVAVNDNTPPDLNIRFVDKRTGAEVTEVSGNRKHFVTVNYDVTDVCDTDATATGVAVPVHAIEDGDVIKIKGRKMTTATLGTSAINVSAEAVDEAGNRRQGRATLLILD